MCAEDFGNKSNIYYLVVSKDKGYLVAIASN